MPLYLVSQGTHSGNRPRAFEAFEAFCLFNNAQYLVGYVAKALMQDLTVHKNFLCTVRSCNKA